MAADSVPRHDQPAARGGDPAAVSRRTFLGGIAAAIGGIPACARSLSSDEPHAVGKFIDSAGFRIPPQVRLIATSGFHSDGDGGSARYAEIAAGATPLPNEAYGFTWFTDAAGRRWHIAENIVHSRQVGAVGDGVVDDTRALRQLLALGGSLRLSPSSAFYRISDEINLPSHTELAGIGNPWVRQLTRGKRALVAMNGTGLHLRDWRLSGAGAAFPFSSGPDDGLITFFANQQNASADIVIENMELFEAYSLAAVMRCARPRLLRNRFHNWMLYGAMMSQTTDGNCDDNDFRDCAQEGPHTAYACSATGGMAAGYPQQNFSFCRNQVDGVPSWDAFMTHQCDGLLISGNMIRNCRTGIDVTTADERISRVVIQDNDITLTTVDTWASRPALHVGIGIHAEGPAPAVANARVESNVVRNANTVRGLHLASSALGAFSFANVNGLDVRNNRSLGQGRSAQGYSAVSVYQPHDGTSIRQTTAQGAFDGYAISVEQRPGDSVSRLVVDGVQIDSPAAAGSLRLHNGTYRNLTFSGLTRDRQTAPALTGNAHLL